MIARNATREQIEAEAERLGASRDAIYQWRIRGIPPAWQIRLMAENPGRLKPEHFATLRRKKGAR